MLALILALVGLPLSSGMQDVGIACHDVVVHTNGSSFRWGSATRTPLLLYDFFHRLRHEDLELVTRWNCIYNYFPIYVSRI